MSELTIRWSRRSKNSSSLRTLARFSMCLECFLGLPRFLILGIGTWESGFLFQSSSGQLQDQPFPSGR